MLRAKRKNRYAEFPIRANWPTVLILAILFFLGLGISWDMKLPGAVLYGLLWVGSYLVIYMGTCRNCVYYGKRCPIPLEGSCVHYFVKPGKAPFGFAGLIWATLAYAMRVALPFFIIVRGNMMVVGSLYGGFLALFWVIHLYVTGCPNCINDECPLNPDH